MSKYRITRGGARVLILLGWAALVIGPTLAVLAAIWLGGPAPNLMPSAGPAWAVALIQSRVTIMVVAAICGFVLALPVGVPLIVVGQLALVTVDQRRLIGAIHRRLEWWARAQEEGGERRPAPARRRMPF